MKNHTWICDFLAVAESLEKKHQERDALTWAWAAQARGQPGSDQVVARLEQTIGFQALEAIIKANAYMEN